MKVEIFSFGGHPNFLDNPLPLHSIEQKFFLDNLLPLHSIEQNYHRSRLINYHVYYEWIQFYQIRPIKSSKLISIIKSINSNYQSQSSSPK